MDEFYMNYTKELLEKIFEELKKGNKEGIKSYINQLKELNKQQFLEKNIETGKELSLWESKELKT